MRSKVADRILANTPEEVKIFARLYGDIVVRVNSILKEKGYTQKSLAEKLDKSPSEIHKWLSGNHNLTLKSIAKLEAELGEPILQVPKDNNYSFSFSNQGTTTFRVFVNSREFEKKPERQWHCVNDFETKYLIQDVG
jgi:transcriptional regulator with XRE-family HTH domain